MDSENFSTFANYFTPSSRTAPDFWKKLLHSQPHALVCLGSTTCASNKGVCIQPAKEGVPAMQKDREDTPLLAGGKHIRPFCTHTSSSGWGSVQEPLDSACLDEVCSLPRRRPHCCTVAPWWRSPWLAVARRRHRAATGAGRGGVEGSPCIHSI